MTGKASDEEAAWRDLVAHFGMPAPDDDAPTPWPAREDLAGPPTAGPPASEGTSTSADPTRADTRAADTASTPTSKTAPATPTPANAAAPGPSTPAESANPPGSQTPADNPTPANTNAPGPATPAETPAADTADTSVAENFADPLIEETPAGVGPVPGVIPAPPQFRIIRPALPSPLPDADDDERYVPPVPPPLPRLDPASKLAWAALFGGPGYLLLSVMAGWQISGVAAFVAVGAFVGGFATLIMRMGDRPPGDSGPDDGAVV